MESYWFYAFIPVPGSLSFQQKSMQGSTYMIAGRLQLKAFLYPTTSFLGNAFSWYFRQQLGEMFTATGIPEGITLKAEPRRQRGSHDLHLPSTALHSFDGKAICEQGLSTAGGKAWDSLSAPLG